MDQYDPDVAPDPEEWLELDEGERQLLVYEFHRRARIRLPNRMLHASMHVIVENQVAAGDALPVAKTLDRLLAEGLDRHDAVHAIASVISEHMWKLLKQGLPVAEDPNDAYHEALGRLSAASWRSG